MYSTNPNQKLIHTKKEPADKKNTYAIFNIDALIVAMNELKGESFKLWCYLNKN